MMKILQATIAVVFLLLSCPGGLTAQEERAKPETAQPEAFSLDSLAWMAGHWRSPKIAARGGERVTEEIWMAPASGLMLGINRDQVPGRPAFFEYLRIEEDSDGITLWASPKGAPATPFRLAEHGAEKVTFANPQHDFPQRILYWLDDQGRLHGRAEATVDGKVRGSEWVWEKVTGP